MSGNMTYSSVPRDKADTIKKDSGQPGQRPGPMMRAILDGEMLHFPDRKPSELSSNNDTARRHGMHLRTKSDGAGGTYVWAEPLS